MILATRHGNREARGLFAPTRLDFSQTSRVPRNSEMGVAYSGRRVTLADAVGIPAVLKAFRLLSETVGTMPLQVVADEDGRQDPQRDAAQWELLHDRPNPPYGSAMAVWSYAVVCLIRGGLVLQKLRTNDGQLVGLEPVAPDVYGGKPVWDDGELVARCRTAKGLVELTLGSGGDALYIPGILLDDPYIGVGVIEAQRHALGNPLGRQQFEGRYLANDGTPSVVLKHPEEQDARQRKAIRDSFTDRHSGPQNAGRPALMWGGWELDKIGLNLADAQFIEAQNFTVQDVARMFGLPSAKLGDNQVPRQSDPRHDDRELLYAVEPWLTKLEQGLHLDDDVFPDKSIEPKFLRAGLLRADPDTRNGAYLKARQAGWMTANEIRRLEGMAPIGGGDELQATPVGGAANPNNPPPATTEPA